MNKNTVSRIGMSIIVILLLMWAMALHMQAKAQMVAAVATPQDLPRFKIIDAQNDMQFGLHIIVIEDTKCGNSYLVVRSTKDNPVHILPIK